MVPSKKSWMSCFKILKKNLEYSLLTLTILHSERPKLYVILVFLGAMGLK